MDADGTIIVESDWLPAAELERLVTQLGSDFPNLAVVPPVSVRRSIDPAVAAAIVSGVLGLLGPFVSKLAERLFKKEPEAAVMLIESNGTVKMTIDGKMPEETRQRLIKTAVSSGQDLSVKISMSDRSL